jgi:hypothetical protein
VHFSAPVILLRKEITGALNKIAHDRFRDRTQVTVILSAAKNLALLSVESARSFASLSMTILYAHRA